MKSIWEEIYRPTQTFTMGEPPELIHIIKTGFTEGRNYMIVHEDALDSDTGYTERATKKEIETTFKIKLSI